jgi:enamine deaminase RidA (YjgF/YER057c/UK114 family)
MVEQILPEGWAAPSGYAHGVLARGWLLAIAGQIGAPPDGPVVAGGIVPQFEQALANVGQVIEAAGGQVDNVISMTVYVVDRASYVAARAELGEVWLRRVGRRYPAMTLVEVKGLVAKGAVVEVQALAVLP